MRKSFIISGLILFFVIFSMAPTLYEWNARGRVHDDRVFELVHNFPTDYNLYLSRVREGKEGAWLATEKYTSEPHGGSLSQILYVLIGRLAHFSHVQTPYVWFAYHTARMFFAALLLWVIWKVVEWSINSTAWQLLTFLLIVTASTWPKFETVAGIPRFGGYMSWYTMTDSLQRTSFHPHVLLAQTLIVFILWVFSGGFITRKTPGNWIFLGVVGIVLGIIFPPGLVFLYGVLGFVSIAELLGKKKTESLFGHLIFGIMTAPTVIYYYLLLSEYPWKRLVEFDVLHPTKFSFVEYFQVMGPVMVIGVIGGIWAIRVGGGKMKYFIAWIVAWLVFMFVFDKIPQQSPTRFTQMAPHIPLGIIVGWMFSILYKRFRGIIVVPIVIILFGLGTMASSYMWIKDFVDHKLRATLPLVPSGAQVMYPMREIIDGLGWLQDHSGRRDVVLSAMTTGNSIPVYSGNTAYVGHANTVHLEEKLIATENFYRGTMPATWLREQRISFVFYGFEEREAAGGTVDLRSVYPSLEQVYESANVRIYKSP